MKRREFLKSCAASPVALKTLSGRGLFKGEKLACNAKGLPTRVLGKTGVSVPRSSALGREAVSARSRIPVRASRS
jgi:hypothetical protein